MPTISVNRDAFLRELGGSWTTEQFEDLCFDYGLELDEDTSITAPEELPHKLKVEIPANRYDLLCHEGLVRSLRVFLDKEKPPVYKVVPPATGAEERYVEVQKETDPIRPYFASAILRNITFTPESYASFIDLQDKLHQNLARKRTLVAIGTHDLDRVARGKITYEARAPKDIKFAPLNRDTEYTADQLMELYETDKHLSRYLHIIKDSPVYPIIYDSTQQVLSMPPIINSQHTKISLDTKNVFIDVTATDRTKLKIVTNMIVTMFAQYTRDPYTVEQVRVVYSDGHTEVTPDLSPVTFNASIDYINSCTGLNLAQSEIIRYLAKMGNTAKPGPSSTVSDKIIVEVPPTRPDILHECDIMEDVAIAYGFNKLKKTFPATNTVASGLAINKLADIVRRESSMSGWTEVLPLILCSHDENFAWLNRKDDGTTAVVLENPKTAEYQIVRTSLLPGLLKSVRENKMHALPMRIFEVSDIVIKDDNEERRARNIRKAGAVYCGKKAGFEIVQGLFDKLMLMLDVENLGNSKGHSKAGKAGYYIQQYDHPTFFPDRAAKIFYRPAADPSAQNAHLMDTGASAANDLQTSVPEPSGPAFTQASNPALDTSSDIKSETTSDAAPEPEQKSTSALDNLKEKLLSALPTSTSTTGSATSRVKAVTADTSKDMEIGIMGILHPTVLGNFDIDNPCSAFEFTLEGL